MAIFIGIYEGFFLYKTKKGYYANRSKNKAEKLFEHADLNFVKANIDDFTLPASNPTSNSTSKKEDLNIPKEQDEWNSKVLREMKALLKSAMESESRMNYLIARYKDAEISLQKSRNAWDKQMEKFKAETIDEVMGLMNQEIFLKKLKKYLDSYVNQTIKAELSNKGVRDIIKNQMQTSLSEDLDESLKKVVERVITSLKSKFSSELLLTKELIYSVDSEIKHCLASTPLSYNAEQHIKDKIFEFLDKQSEMVRAGTKKALENMTDDSPIQT